MFQLLSTIRHYSHKGITPLRLSYLFDYGKCGNMEKIVKQSIFLHNELPIRLAHRFVELEKLPYNVCKIPSMQEV